MAQAQSASTGASPSEAQPSIEQIRVKAEAGDASSQYELAGAYRQGAGIPKDDTQAFNWCLKSAQQEYLKAELTLAWLYQNGIGTAKDEAASFQWYQKAASQGSAAAEIIVGQHYYEGSDVAKSTEEALTWIKKAANQNDGTAEQLLALFYLYGDAPLRDEKKGFSYALLASGKNNVAASYVADCYARGVFVQADPMYAYAYALNSNALGATEWNSKHLTEYKSKLAPEELEKSVQFSKLLLNRGAGASQTSNLSFVLGGKPSITIPFRSVMNLIVIKASVGGEPPADFVLDTGAPSTCLDSRYAAQIALTSNDYRAIFDLGMEPVLTSSSDPKKLTLGDLTWNEVHFTLSPLTIDSDLGQPIAGIIGSDVLTQLVLRIDYQHKFIELIDPKSFHPTSETSDSVPLNFEFELPLPFVPASLINAKMESKKENFLFDTGNTGLLDIGPGFLTDNPGFALVSDEATGAAGFDGVLVHSNRAVCPVVAIGSTRLENVPVDVRQVASGGNINPNGGTIGNEIWRRYTVTIDYPGKKLYLEKNSSVGEPWRYPKAGMRVVAGGPNYTTFTVMQILPDGAAARAGFQLGDLILKINDLDHLTLEQIQNTFSTAGDYHVLVRRQQQTVELNLICVKHLK